MLHSKIPPLLWMTVVAGLLTESNDDFKGKKILTQMGI